MATLPEALVGLAVFVVSTGSDTAYPAATCTESEIFDDFQSSLRSVLSNGRLFFLLPSASSIRNSAVGILDELKEAPARLYLVLFPRRCH